MKPRNRPAANIVAAANLRKRLLAMIASLDRLALLVICATGTLFVDGTQVAEGRIPQTVPIRFSLDETFDIGEDTGTPVVEDYVGKMPFPFTGTLKKFVVILEPEKLTEEERNRLLKEEAKGWDGRSIIGDGRT